LQMVDPASTCRRATQLSKATSSAYSLTEIQAREGTGWLALPSSEARLRLAGRCQAPAMSSLEISMQTYPARLGPEPESTCTAEVAVWSRVILSANLIGRIVYLRTW